MAVVAGRIDFAALQRRPAGQVSLVVFDILADRGVDLRPWPYSTRRARLEQLLTGAGPGLALVPKTEDAAAARAWLAEHNESGIEGVVAKALHDPYQPGRRWWSKVKLRTTVEVVVGGVIGSLDTPRGLILGRYDDSDRFRIVGRTVPLSRAAATSLSVVLRLPERKHPWPEELPAVPCLSQDLLS